MCSSPSISPMMKLFFFTNICNCKNRSQFSSTFDPILFSYTFIRDQTPLRVSHPRIYVHSYVHYFDTLKFVRGCRVNLIENSLVANC